MKRMLICLGGTGQMVLHYFSQLFLVGRIRSPFKAVVIDTDEVLPSIHRLSDFFEELSHAKADLGVDGQPKPEIVLVPVQPKGGEKAYTLLTGRNPEESTNSDHACHAFFNRDTLFQELTKGLFARPVLSSTLSTDALNPYPLAPEHEATVVAVASVLGGTGGGLVARVIDQIHTHIRDNALNQVTTRAVFFGEYFRPDPQKIEGGVARFQSNQRWVLKALGESIQILQRFRIIGGPGNSNLMDRNPDWEKRAEYLDWPGAETSPYWEGASTLEYLLEETTRDWKSEFADREIEQVQPLPLPKCQDSLKRSLGIVDALSRHQILVRLAREPFQRSVWGKTLPRLLAHYLEIARSVEHDESLGMKTFSTKVQHHLEQQWRAGPYSLSMVFPSIPFRRPRVAEVRKLAWPVPRVEAHLDHFETLDRTAAKAATAILFHAFRGTA